MISAIISLKISVFTTYDLGDYITHDLGVYTTYDLGDLSPMISVFTTYDLGDLSLMISAGGRPPPRQVHAAQCDGVGRAGPGEPCPTAGVVYHCLID